MSDRTATTTGRQHLRQLREGIAALERHTDRIDRWGAELARILCGGGRLLVAGNGGSAAEAQHLTAELVGRYVSERPPFSAVALHADTSAVTAIGNDYGFEQVYARQVLAHGRPGDVLVALSQSGRSPNLLAAADAARRTRMHTWALTGPSPNPLASRCDEAVAIDAPNPVVQELHLVAVHLLCAAFDQAVARTLDRTAVDLTDVEAAG